MLTIEFVNDGTGPNAAANYRVLVVVNALIIARCRVLGHPRSEDWRALVRRLAEQLDAEDV